MIHSMTGFGQAQIHFSGKTIHVEIKALNSKNFDVTVHMPSSFREYEMQVRNLLQSKLIRGKIDIHIWIEQEICEAPVRINFDVVRAYIEQMRQVTESSNLQITNENLWPTLIRMPDVLTTPQSQLITNEEGLAMLEVVNNAAQLLIKFREQEGKALQEMFLQKIGNIEQLMVQMIPYEASRVERIRERLEERLVECCGTAYDSGRLEQELIYYIEKLDISEEKQRLSNHLAYFKETLNAPIGQGKKLGFIAQEMGREINTTGSKSNQAEMQNIVVRMKDELEQIKEQVLNVL